MPFPDSNSVWKEQHPDEGILHEWLEEQLDTEAAARIAAHVSTCETCRARVAEAHGLIAASRRILTSLDDVPAGVIPATSNVARITKDNNIVSISKSVADATATSVTSSARANASSASAVRTSSAKPTSIRWRQWGSIAAVLAIGVTGLFVVSKKGENASILSTVAAPATESAPSSAPPVAGGQQPVAQSAPQSVGAASSTSTPAQTAVAATAPAAPPASAPVATPSANAASSLGVVARDATPHDSTASAKRAPVDAQLRLSKLSERRDVARDEISGRGVAAPKIAAAVIPPAVSSSNSDTLAQRLETERRKAAAAEAVAADPAQRPRIEPLAAGAQAYSAPAKQRAATMSATRGAPPTTSAAKGAGDREVQSSRASAPMPVQDVTFDSLTMSREPCFGRCPAYELRVSGAGAVHYRSQHQDDNGRTYTAQLPDSVVSRLSNLIERSRVDTLKSYMPGLPTCMNARTDSPTLHLTVFRAGRAFKVDQYTGCSEATPAVPTLIREIDTIVGTQRWLPTGYRIP